LHLWLLLLLLLLRQQQRLLWCVRCVRCVLLLLLLGARGWCVQWQCVTVVPDHW
jgi:hypothetical protein